MAGEQAPYTVLSPDGGNTWTSDPNKVPQVNSTTSGAPPGTIDPGSINNGQWGTSGTGSQQSPITYSQFWQAAQDPYRQQGLDAIGGMNKTILQGYGPGGSSLAGLTTLAPVANARTATIDTGQSQNILGGQLTNINDLYGMAQGRGPSVAANTADAQREANIKAGMAMLGSQRGASNPALGLRQAQDQVADANQNAAWNAVQGRTQEALGARQQLTGALSGTMGQVQQGAQAQAGMAQQAGLANAGAANQLNTQQGQMDVQTKLANLQAQLQAGQINAQQYNDYVQALMSQNNNDWGAQMNAMNAMMNNSMQAQGLYHTGTVVNGANNSYGLTSAGIGGAAALGAGALTAASDEGLKTAIRSAKRGIQDFLTQIGGSLG